MLVGGLEHFLFSISYGTSSFPLTNSIIFQDGYCTTNQTMVYDIWNYSWLVVWNMIFLTFHMLGIIIPIDFHIFQRGWNHQPVKHIPCEYDILSYILCQSKTMLGHLSYSQRNYYQYMCHGLSSIHVWNWIYQLNFPRIVRVSPIKFSRDRWCFTSKSHCNSTRSRISLT